MKQRMIIYKNRKILTEMNGIEMTLTKYKTMEEVDKDMAMRGCIRSVRKQFDGNKKE